MGQPEMSRHASGDSSEHSKSGTPLTEYSVDEYSSDDIAVVGLACRVAGSNNTPEQLWQSLLEKKDASGEIPAMRWAPYYQRDSRNPKELAKTTSRGYFVEGLENFDAQFFGISPKEAEQMDPQQRVSLEVAWEALENAGIPPQSLSGSDTSVFWGVNSDDYSKLLLEDLPNVDAWMGIGTAYCGVPNRISYHLNLMGPSTAVDAACASGLVAVHHGRQAILAKESTIAIVGGVNALGGPGLTRVLDKAGAVSPEGRCRSFDDSAHGYGRGEGAGAIILKSMAEAIRDDDNIIAVLKGSAVAQDGKTNGIMAPNAYAQQIVANKALEVGKVDPLTVQYVEAHATSTPLGDPTEVSAVSAVYGKDRSTEDPCLIGSIKPNIGHLEAGAGAMGFIKAVMAVNKAVIPPQANLEKLNSKVDWKKAGVKVVQETTEWPAVAEGLPRRAAVASYGYGGTVSHAVIEEFRGSAAGLPPSARILRSHVRSNGPFNLLLSGPQEKRLAVEAKSLSTWLQTEAGSQQPLSEIASTLAKRRGHHDYRAALVVEDHEDAIKVLTALANGSADQFTTASRVLPSDVRKDIVWVFAGHGSQWGDMGKELITNKIFMDTITPLDAIVQREIGFSAIELLKTGDFDSSDRVQVLTYLVQVGLIEILQDKGVQPQAVIGHSVGEIAASVAAGAITPEEGTLIVTRRAKLYRRVMGLGGMILVNKPFADVSKELSGTPTQLVAAIDSSPNSCVVAGPKDEVEAAAAKFKEEGVKTFTVKTDIAFHSPMLNELMKPLLEELEGELSPKLPKVQLYSTSLADPRGRDPRDPAYWANNMVNPVLLKSAVNAALDDGYRIMMEISAHPLVSHSITETILDRGIEDYAVIPTMLRNKPTMKRILNGIGQLHCKGASVDWQQEFRATSWAPNVPTVTWLHKPYWRQVTTSTGGASANHDVDKHTLLGQRIPVAGTDVVVYTTRLDNETKPFPGSHPLHGTEIVPAAGLVNTFVHGAGVKVLKNVVLRVPVAINAPRQVQIVVQQAQAKITSTLIGEKDSDTSGWVTHTTTLLDREGAQDPAPFAVNIEEAKKRIGNKLADNFSIDYLDKVGVSAMGFPWAVTEHYGTTKEMIARVDAAPGVTEGAELPWDVNSWAPMLDAATSVGSTLFFDEPRLRMPAQIERVDVFTDLPPPKVGWLHVTEATDTAIASHVTVLSEAGHPLARFTSMRFSEIEGTPGVSGSMESLIHQLAWPPAQMSESAAPLSNVVFVADTDAASTARSYASSLPASMPWELVSSAKDLADKAAGIWLGKGAAVVYVPGEVSSANEVPASVEHESGALLDVAKYLIVSAPASKLFVLTNNAFKAKSPTALAHGALFGLSRIIASEHPDVFGGHFDTESTTLPVTYFKYVQGADVLRIEDGVARTSRLRTLPREKLLSSTQAKINLMPRADGTYLITGGLGALGMAVAEFLVEQGARRVVLLSRRGLPPRRLWEETLASGELGEDEKQLIGRMIAMEARGASVYVLSVDIGRSDAAEGVISGLDRLALPPVRGVVHAAGVLENELVQETTREAFAKVLAPKVQGALALDAAFPVKTLDFFIMFSSCGQLFGFPGQSSYATGNAFLDSLVTQRRSKGDNAVSFQWTSWRGMGMGASTDFINAELESKGITDVTRDEAFGAWQHLARFDMDHGVVLRSRAFDDGEPLPVPILNDIAVRRARQNEGGDGQAGSNSANASASMPTSGPELKTYLDEAIRNCVAKVLHAGGPDDVDSKAALSDLGIDSVMTVTLRRELQTALKVKVPPTLTWSHPTVSHLVPWFAEKIENK